LAALRTKTPIENVGQRCGGAAVLDNGVAVRDGGAAVRDGAISRYLCRSYLTTRE
jgi:hypothetical protein